MGGKRKHDYAFILGNRGQKGCFYWGVSNVLEKLVMGQSMWFFQPKKENYENTYEQIS